MNSKPLYIRLSVVSKAMSDKELFDALTLVLAIKLTFRSSCVHNADIRHLKTLFGCGYNTLKRALNRGIKEGLLEYQGCNIISKSLKVEDKDVYLRYTRSTGTYSNGDTHTLREVARGLRKLYLQHLVLMKQETCDTLMKANGEKSCSLKEMKSKMRSAKGMHNKGFLKMEGMSHAYLASKLNVTTRTIQTYIKELQEEGRLEVISRCSATAMPMKELTRGKKYLSVKKNYSGFFFGRKGIVYQRLTHAYRTYDFISGVYNF